MVFHENPSIEIFVFSSQPTKMSPSCFIVAKHIISYEKIQKNIDRSKISYYIFLKFTLLTVFKAEAYKDGPERPEKLELFIVSLPEDDEFIVELTVEFIESLKSELFIFSDLSAGRKSSLSTFNIP